jgi:flavin reductase
MAQIRPIMEAGEPIGAANDSPAVAPELFRDAMALLAGGVAVAACWDGEQPTGLLVSSITTLSTEPPRVLFCVRKAASSHDALLRAAHCSVAILAEDDQDEAERFSRFERRAERFDPQLWRLDPASPPRRHEPLIGLHGQIGNRIDAGTHTIFILNVHAVETRRGAPLVYFERAFRGLKPDLVGL